MGQRLLAGQATVWRMTAPDHDTHATPSHPTVAPSSFAPPSTADVPVTLAQARADVALAVCRLCALPGSFDSPVGRDVLREAVARYVRELRAAGLRAEQVVVEVKRLLDEGGARDARRPGVVLMAEHVVSWAIDDYYE